MSGPRLVRIGVIALSLLHSVVGCQGTGCFRSTKEGEIPPEPGCVQTQEGGALLKTGALQLGPGVGKDLLRFRGDGEGGFFSAD